MRRLLLALAAVVLLALPAKAQTVSQPGSGCSNNCTFTGTTTAGDIRASSFQPTAQTALYGLRGNGATDSTGILDLEINNSVVERLSNGAALFGLPNGGSGTQNSSVVTIDVSANFAHSMSLHNGSGGAAAGMAIYLGNNVSTTYASLMLNSSGNSTGNGANSLTLNNTAGLFLQNAGVNAITISGTQAVGLPNIASSSAAQTGTVCWTTGGGNLTVDTTAACLVSLEDLKNIKGPIDHALDKIMAIKPFWFTWKDPTMDPAEQPGMGAHQVESVDPRLAAYGADGTLRSVRYQEMTAVLVAAMQTQQEEIRAMGAAIAGLLILLAGIGWRTRRHAQISS